MRSEFFQYLFIPGGAVNSLALRKENLIIALYY